jgi:cytochrome b6-f complex iron-sulfur subunit
MEKSEIINHYLTKRNFLKAFFIAIAGYVVALLGSTVRFMAPNVSYDPPTTFKAGYVDDYAMGTFSDRWLDKQKVWIQRKRGGLVAFIAVCTHLGCVPKLVVDDNRITCSCHGTNFTLEGDVISGPAPVPLYRAAIKLSADGQIIVDKEKRENRPGLRDKEPYVLKA